MLSPPPHTLSLSPPLLFLFLHTRSSTLILPSSSPPRYLWFFFFFPFFLHTRFSLSLYLPLLFFLFLPHSRSAFSLFFSPALGLWFFFLLDSRTAVVFVRRVGGRVHLCNFTLRAAFSPQFSSQFGRKKLVDSGGKFSPGFSILSVFLYFPNSGKHCFSHHFPPIVFHPPYNPSNQT